MADNGTPLILLTRPRAQADRFAAATRAVAETLVIPLQEIAPSGPIPPLGDYAGLIFTSENGVRVFADRSPNRDLVAWCVGGRSAAVAQEAGFSTRVGGGSADALVEDILAAVPSGRLLHLHGRHTRGEVAKRLTAAGQPTDEVEIYEQRAIDPDPPLVGLAASRPVFAPLFSPRSAALFSAAIDQDVGDWRPACLSAAVRDALPKGLRDKAPTAAEPTADAMLRLLVRHISH